MRQFYKPDESISKSSQTIEALAEHAPAIYQLKLFT